MMGFSCCIGIKMPKLVSDLLSLVEYVKLLMVAALFHLGLLTLFRPSHLRDAHGADHVQESGGYLPSLTSPVVPATVLTPTRLEAIKKRLPAVEFGDFLERSGGNREEMEHQSVCMICLCSLEKRHEIRELPNCCHVFHRECLDKWVDGSQLTCPLCRSKLLPCRGGGDHSKAAAGGGGGDPWMLERFSYLFGEEIF
ncbi:PREDICTED: probable E3 ubiquitin-protein ligase RHA1A [Nelumbo nucifera]|uniref:RING-type domain-containing protein n=2 Tax=Nelumbo nucifera TaxID=4432 RepID=A0A822YTX7_NELNU|nr:PREDICTED: probable E3 ubiquitin-protein ligase RHA1A [Nelumbo nucifera]DAD36102.1 TPA_asm: hypothetical protein HUJ06_006742 [Nelumbo nucifera]